MHGYNPLGNGKLDILQQNDPVGIDKSENVSQTDPNILKYVRGKIMLAVEAHGEAYYVNPSDGNGYYLGHADDAYQIMRNLSLGITDANLGKIPVAGTSDAGDLSLRQRLAGKILLAVESHGEAWYVHPVTLQRHYLGRAEDAYQIMREQGVGISNENLKRLRKVY